MKLREFHFKFLAPSGGKIVRGGKPLFSWKIPPNNLVFRIVIDLFDNPSFVDLTSSKETKIELMSPQGNAVRIRKALPDGTWHWRIRAFLGRDEVARSSFQSFRVASGGESHSPLPSRVRLYTSVPQPSFFPIGMFAANPNNFDELKKAGFNSVQSYLGEPIKIRKLLEAATKSGLKALVSVPILKNKIRFHRFIKEASSSPALLAWYIEDEPEGRGVSPAKLWSRRLNLNRLSGNHPTGLTLIRSRMTPYYGPAADVILVDPYPIPRHPITWLSNSISDVHRSLGPNKPVWAIIQAFNWGLEPNFPMGKPGRFPTLAEERAMTYLAVVHGARGIFFFAEKHARKDLKHWNNLKKLAGALRCLYPLFLSTGKTSQPVLISPVRDPNGKPVIHYLSKKLENKSSASPNFGCPLLKEGNYLIAVNTRKKPTAMQLRGLETNTGYASDVFTSKKLKIQKREVRDTLESYGVRIWRLGKVR